MIDDDSASFRVLNTEWSGPMGNLALIDQYLKLHRLGLIDGQPLMLGNSWDVANPFLYRLWSKIIPTAHATGALLAALEHYLWPISEQVEVRTTRVGILDLYRWLEIADVEWARQQRSPLIEVDPEIVERGDRVLRKWGLSDGDWFAAVHVRDSGTPARDVANADIDTYLDAFRTIVNNGGWVIRMGVPASKLLARAKGIVDYSQATTRAGWMDLFLWARCRFFIGTASGPLSVPSIFGRPTLTTNSPALGLAFSFNKGLEVPKLLVSAGHEKRLMTLRKSLGHRAAWTASTRVLGGDVELTDCTSRHIDLATRDMLERREDDPAWALTRRATDIRRESGARGVTTYSPGFLEAVMEESPDFLE